MPSFETWLSELPLDEVKADLRRLESERAKLDLEIEARKQAIALAHAVGVPTPPQRLDAEGGEVPNSTDRPMPSVAILEIIRGEPTRAWSFGDLMDTLVRRGWADDTLSEHKRIQVAASRLVTKGQLLRVGPGVYQAPTPDPLGRPWGTVPTGFTRFSGAGEP